MVCGFIELPLWCTVPYVWSLSLTPEPQQGVHQVRESGDSRGAEKREAEVRELVHMSDVREILLEPQATGLPRDCLLITL